MRTIALAGKYKHLEVKLDDEDYYRFVMYSIYHQTKGYAVIYRGGTLILLHRLIVNAPKGKDVDHINGNKLDNRRCNLRVCSRGINVQNQKSWAKSGYKGVNKNGNYWQANIYYDKKRQFLGNFKTIEQAAVAYNEAAYSLYGEHAQLNVV
jgi:hypothetical protein